MIILRILVVEDEFSLADIIATKLRKEKYNVDISSDGEEGLDNALSGVYDLIILDIMLPKINGIEILKEIRKSNIDTKVIMLTAKSSLDDKLIGFENGANDYITKPFHIEELIARVNVQLRNNEKNINKDILKFGDIELNVRTSTITCTKNNESINVSYKELMILEYLLNNSNQIISKEQIYDKIWGIDTDFESKEVFSHANAACHRISHFGGHPAAPLAVPGSKDPGGLCDDRLLRHNAAVALHPVRKPGKTTCGFSAAERPLVRGISGGRAGLCLCPHGVSALAPGLSLWSGVHEPGRGRGSLFCILSGRLWRCSGHCLCRQHFDHVLLL